MGFKDNSVAYTAADISRDLSLRIGDTVKTYGVLEPGDGGGGMYRIIFPSRNDARLVIGAIDIYDGKSPHPVMRAVRIDEE